MPDETHTRKDRDANRDPITGTPGSHPVGTGVGAAAGGAAGAAAGVATGAAVGTAGGGPIGGVVGAAIGAVAGGLAGKGVAESVNPTEEDAYWREHHRNESYYNSSYSYDDYQGAYRTGYEGYGRFASSGRRYEDVEDELRRDYERNRGTSRLEWENARPAVRAAWSRFDVNLERYLGYDVVDRNSNKIGTLDCLWADHTGQPAFVGIRTGWFMGRTHVVPAQSVEVAERSHRLRLPYTEDQVRNAPAYDADADITEDSEHEIYAHYGISPRPLATSTGVGTPPYVSGTTHHSTEGTLNRETNLASNVGTSAIYDRPARTADQREEATMQLSEEQLRVQKREVEAGGVRLRKVVRTEVVNQPVELRREEVVIERVPASEAQQVGGTTAGAFQEQEVYIPLRREEASVRKETHVREEVRARKESQTETENVTEEIRREDVEVERTGEAKERGTKSPRSRKKP